MKIPEAVFEELSIKGTLKQNPTILLWDRPDANILTRFNLEGDNCLVGAKGLSTDIKVNTKFDTLFMLHDPEAFLEVEVSLGSVYLNPSKVIDHLPKGYTNLCLLSFKKGVPVILDKLKLYNEKMDDTKHDVLYLTQRAVLNEILALNNKIL